MTLGNKLSIGISLFFILLSIFLLIAFVYVSAHRPMTSLENVLFQVFILCASFLGSFLVGRLSSARTAKEMIKPHARSAFRRLMSLYKSLSRLALTIASAQEQNNSKERDVYSVLDKLQAIVTEQIATADDALEDWRDIIPKDVEDIKKHISQKMTVKGEPKS